MKIIVEENTKALVFRDGKLVTLLNTGKYRMFGNISTEVLDMRQNAESIHCTLKQLLKLPEFANQVTVQEVGDAEIGIHLLDGKYNSTITAGTHAFWNENGTHTFILVDMSNPEIPDTVSKALLQKMPKNLYHKFEIHEYEVGRLYFDNQFIRLLKPGTYMYWNGITKVTADAIDIRLQQLNLQTQEMLTQDKIEVRTNFLCHYRITDYIKITNEIENYKEQIYAAAQLALREYISTHKLDELLEAKAEMAEYVLAALKAKEASYFVEFEDAGVKDLILPGEIRDIMNMVLVAEKRAQASVITRREEVASTRSLLNTAKLMDENQTLYKLKELEYLEHICEKVGNITLNGNGDVLTQLANLVNAQKKS